MDKSLPLKIVYALRNLRSRSLFRALEQYCRGDVLDIGGWDFYNAVAKNSGIKFRTWTTLELNDQRLPEIDDPKFRAVKGNGCAMEFPDSSFDTVLNIQVLEHVFEPIKMVKEIARVLKPGGYGIFLIPQTSVLHDAPYHYYNFTKFWIMKAMDGASLDILELKPLGGLWSTTASHMFYFFFKVFRVEGYSTSEAQRSVLFYVLLPFAALFAMVGLGFGLLFGLSDLTEDPNNFLVVVRKRK